MPFPLCGMSCMLVYNWMSVPDASEAPTRPNELEGMDIMTNYEDKLTPEQMEKARACKDSDDLVQLAKDEGVELNDEQLEAIAGGTWYDCMNETW